MAHARFPLRSLGASLALAALTLLAPQYARATLVLGYADPAGDGMARGDVVAVQALVDSGTGAYTVTWTADAADPFNGDLVLNLNLGNQRLGGSLVALSHTFVAVVSTNQLTYSGVESALTQWMAGDMVSTFGDSPQFNTTFYSGLLDPHSHQSPACAIGNRDCVPGTAQLLPEPATPLLLGLGLTGILVGRRKRRPTP